MKQLKHQWPYKWESRFLDMAKLVSTWSKDKSHQVGAVIVNPRKRIVGLGYNGPPEKVEYEGPDKCLVIHAEINAILNSDVSLDGCTIYIYPFLPCAQCAATIIQKGITRVVTSNQLVSSKWHPNAALRAFHEAGIPVLIDRG